MRGPFSVIYLLAFIFLISFLLAFVQVGIITIAFDKLGLSISSGFLLLFSSLFGSTINLPLFTVRAESPEEDLTNISPMLRGLLHHLHQQFTGTTLIAVNVGGCLIPLTFCIYLIVNTPVPALDILGAITLVTIVSYLVSRPIAGLGIAMPIFIAPVSAALAALIINGEHSAPLAYIAGTFGVLVGADLLRLGNIRQLGTPVASIGGAGTFDGIFLTGIVAVLLA